MHNDTQKEKVVERLVLCWCNRTSQTAFQAQSEWSSIDPKICGLFSHHFWPVCLASGKKAKLQIVPKGISEIVDGAGEQWLPLNRGPSQLIQVVTF